MEELLADLKPYLDFKILSAFLIDFGLRVVVAAAIFFIGRWLAGRVSRAAKRMLTKARVDPTLTSFLTNVINVALLVMVIVMTINQLGIQTTSIAAVIAAAGLAVGLALQGSLSNFAAGVLIILFKPFKVGDSIESTGLTGTVEEINIFTTTMRAADNRTFIIPNSSITSDSIINYTNRTQRRIGVEIPVSHQMDMDEARQIIKEVLNTDKRIHQEPAPLIVVKSLENWGAVISVAAWVDTPDFFDAQDAVIEELWKRFQARKNVFPAAPAIPVPVES